MEKKKRLLVVRAVLLAIVIGTVFFIYFYSQASKLNVNRVNINNMKDDNSTNYRYIFREIIEKERHEEELKKIKEFK